MVRVIKIAIRTEAATVAIAHQLKMGNRIKSKKFFWEVLSSYFSNYGHSCIDDHEGEDREHREHAKYLINKYFN